jgi:UDP-glucose 4-epimerase
MPKNTILIAGGTAIHARAFCTLAADNGYTPVEISNIGDEQHVLAISEEHKPIAVVYLGAAHNPAAPPETIWEDNFYSVMRFFNALERGGVRHVVFSSTADVYGLSTKHRPHVEEDALNPTTPHSMAALSCEIALQGLYNRQESSDAFIDEFSRRMMKVKFTYPEFRTSFFPCLKSVILRTHGADDITQAYLLGLTYLSKGGKSDVFNVGTVADSIDATKAKTILGWPSQL